MKLTKEQFKKFVLEEVSKLISKENDSAVNKNEPIVSESDNKESVINAILSIKGNEDIAKDELEKLPDSELFQIYQSQKGFTEPFSLNEKTESEEPKIEVSEVKRLAEEFTRMKELVDFRSPLLRKDNQ